MDDPRDRILDAALRNVPFDGWSERTLRRAAADAGVALAEARALFPRGAVDLAMAYHRRGDREMARRVAAEDPGQMRYRDRVARALWLRLECADKDAVRRATTLFALPVHAATGARAMWETADAIWRALGDASADGNWYSKRATLAGVYAAAVLFWLGDESQDHEETREFIDRRIEGVMRFERMKAAMAANPLGRALMAGPNWAMSRMGPPPQMRGFPGRGGGRR